MVQGRTSSGFAFSVDPEAIRDMRFIEAAADSEENSLLLPKVITMALGKEQKERLYLHVQNEAGRVPAEDVSREFGEIMDCLGKHSETKN